MLACRRFGLVLLVARLAESKADINIIMGEEEEGRSLEVTPTYTVATVLSAMVVTSFFFNAALETCAKWLEKNWKGSLCAALEKIREELMAIGVLSLMMAHFRGHLPNICIKHDLGVRRFSPCASLEAYNNLDSNYHYYYSSSIKLSHLLPLHLNNKDQSNLSTPKTTTSPACPQGEEPFIISEPFEQLHRLLFVLVVVHVYYSFVSVALAMSKIYSWTVWESQAISLSLAADGAQGARTSTMRPSITRMTTFVSNHASHPWTQNRVLVWLLCFSRQFWSSIAQADYMALRIGFITTHQLPLSYNFHNYMLRSMKEDFRDICGISLTLWIYAILCIILDFQGSKIYFWLSFLPTLLVLLLGTELQNVVVKLATEIKEEACPQTSCWTTNNNNNNKFKLRDELFWFGKPRLLLWLIQLISFQNAFEMATFLWSLWEISDGSCFMENSTLMATRLVFGIISLIWCSFTTFPLYVIITQMGSKFKRPIVSQQVRASLKSWMKRAKARRNAESSSFISRSNSSIFSWNSRSINSITGGGYSFARISRNTSSSSSKLSCKSLKMLMEEDQQLPSMSNRPPSFLN